MMRHSRSSRFALAWAFQLIRELAVERLWTFGRFSITVVIGPRRSTVSISVGGVGHGSLLLEDFH